MACFGREASFEGKYLYVHFISGGTRGGNEVRVKEIILELLEIFCGESTQGTPLERSVIPSCPGVGSPQPGEGRPAPAAVAPSPGPVRPGHGGQ